RSRPDRRGGAERLGLRADVRDERGGHQARETRPEEKPEAEGEAQRRRRAEDRGVGEPVGGRVEEGAQTGAAAGRPRYRAVQRVGGRADEERDERGERLVERDEGAAHDGEGRPEQRDRVGRDADASERAGERRDAHACALGDTVWDDAVTHETPASARFMSSRIPRALRWAKRSRSNVQRTSRPTRSVRTIPA